MRSDPTRTAIDGREIGMYRLMEKVGGKFLGLFVPEVEAAASANACRWKYFSSCWQCGYGACDAYCCDGAGCSTIVCY
ncbi:hypothetical protein [Micromonospora sp. NPDC092111]|uniref:hypothetical protein n=1 Tax=Micromonospora sp. NPDC092111 TaxID=3364289 RepID=UPI003821CFC1